jgi:hypothetical protein
MKGLLDKGVLILMSHLIITILLIAGYVFTLYNGHGDDTLKGILFTVVGYWFGAVGLDKVKKGGKGNE